ncbi:bifunctional enoyl-CoA hydratase/phosphate acetyltransferase [Paenibacillus puldeungensis]|uniref:Bifunctional enoyl-CoA hydratase/phosphate acetyltransferase n=1 Tax=Paenibacillus puldeungensis TaxID=696536 RepID=A0ABW3RQZ7_9BACL
MSIKCFKDLVDSVQKREKKTRVAVVAAQDEHTLDSVVQATKDQLIVPILIGDESKIKAIFESMGQRAEDYDIVNEQEIDDCLQVAIGLVKDGKADAMMKGKLETGQFMKSVVKDPDMKKGGLISLMGFYETDKYHKLFAVSDMGMNTYPDLEGKKKILLNAVNVFHAIGIENPKVAVMAAVEKVNPKMPETVDAGQLKQMNQTGEIRGCIVEGPISFDLATSKEAADVKGYESPVAGDADLLLVPDIVSGNILVKCLTGIAGASTAGIIIGARVPLIVTSRSAEASDKYNSIALTAFVGQNY